MISIPRIFLALLAERDFLCPVCIHHLGHPQSASHLLKVIFSFKNQLARVLLFQLKGSLWWWEALVQGAGFSRRDNGGQMRDAQRGELYPAVWSVC